MLSRICIKARPSDLHAVVELQNANLVTNLSSDEKKDGFLSGAFSEEQFALMNDDVCVLVCLEDDIVIGFLCVGSLMFNEQYPLPAAMIREFSKLSFKKRSLKSYESVIAGPVCVAKEARGTGLFELMYSELPKLLPAQTTLITTLVSEANPRSLRAHEKVGMATVGRFGFGSKDFVIMARLVHP